MKKVFLDTNVLLDFLLDREPFNMDIAEILEISLNEGIELCVSSVTITDTHYIIGRSEGVRSADSKVKKILEFVSVENVGQYAIRKSLDSSFKDFEDGVQNYCALESKHKIIVTRNVKDFTESELAIFTPTELLAKINSANYSISS